MWSQNLAKARKHSVQAQRFPVPNRRQIQVRPPCPPLNNKRARKGDAAHLVLLRSSTISQRVFELEARRGLSQELIRSVGTSFSHILPDGS